jgi:ATP-dependent helicase/nuclease subunit A
MLDRVLTAETSPLRCTVAETLTEILTTFGASEPYGRLKAADILGREVPFMMPWGEGQVMEGIIDVIYRLDGEIRIADYKTDRTTSSEAQARAGLYTQQAAIYREAAIRCLGLSQVPFQFIFLRAGVSVDV